MIRAGTVRRHDAAMIGCFPDAMQRGLILIASLAIAPSTRAQEAQDDRLMAAYRQKTQVVRPCDRSGDAIVVCGTQAERNARERLPLPRAEVQGAASVRGDAPRASASAARQGSCGVVGGQGTGCTGGLSVFQVVGVIAKVAKGIVDSDADLSLPPALPPRFEGAGQH